MWNKHLQQKAVMSHNSLSAHHCHPPKEKAQEFGLSFPHFFSKTHTHTHFAPFLYVALNQIKLLSRKYIYLLQLEHILSWSYSYLIYMWFITVKLHNPSASCTKTAAKETMRLHHCWRVYLLKKRKRMFHWCQILVQLGKGGLQKAF